MNCPTCKKGTLRVIIHFACSCGHHPLVCDKCLAHFSVEHGEPYGPLKLPPEHPITSEAEIDKAFKEDETVSEDEYREAVETLPTIEECKEYYEGSPDDSEEELEEDDDEDSDPN